MTNKNFILLLLAALIPLIAASAMAEKAYPKKQAAPDQELGLKDRFVLGLRFIGTKTEDENRVLFSTPDGDVIAPVIDSFDAYAWTTDKSKAVEIANLMLECISPELRKIVKVEILPDHDVGESKLNFWYPEGIVNDRPGTPSIPFEKVADYLKSLRLYPGGAFE